MMVFPNLNLKGNKMILCINCKYFEIAQGARTTFAKCTRGRVNSPVDGSPTPLDELPYCSIERNSTVPEKCQMDAIYFVEKETANV